MSVRKRTLPRTGETRWLVDYSDADGHRRAKQFAKKADALAFETRVRGELRDGIHVPESTSPTIDRALDMWISSREAKGIERSTAQTYRSHARHHIRPLIGNMTLAQFSTVAGQAFVNRLLQEGRSPALVRKVRVSLSSMFSEMQRLGLCATNPMRAVEVTANGSRDEESTEYPTMPEIEALLATAEGGFTRTFIHIAIFTGLRASELRGLTWEHIDLKDGILHVRQRADRFGVIGRPKSRAGKRDVPLGAHVLALLREWKLAQPSAQRAKGLVFPDRKGGIEDHQQIYRIVGAVQARCGLVVPRLDKDGKPLLDEAGKPVMRQKFGPHALRHACASLLIADGWAVKRVQTYLGHASLKMTLGIYAHVFRDDATDQKALGRLEAKLLGR